MSAGNGHLGFEPALAMAIVAPSDRLDHARFFELTATNRGFNIHAFEDFERAIDWLQERLGRERAREPS